MTSRGRTAIIGHVSRDSTAIPARETPAKRTKPPKAKRRRGRPRKGEERPPKPETRLRRQLRMSVPEMLEDLPKARGWSCKRNSMGKTETWKGWKCHTGTADGGAPAGFVPRPGPRQPGGDPAGGDDRGPDHASLRADGPGL